MSRLMIKPTKWLCAQRRLRSAWASAQSDQNLRCPHEESLGPLLHTERTAKTLIKLGGCPGWSESSLGAHVILLVLSWGGSNEERRRDENRASMRNGRVLMKIPFKENNGKQLDRVKRIWYLSHDASSEGSGEHAHPRSLARISAAHSHKQWVKRNLQTESQIPGPSEWLGMRC